MTQVSDSEIFYKRMSIFVPASQFQNGDNAAGIVISRIADPASSPFNGVVFDNSAGGPAGGPGNTGHAVGDLIEGYWVVPWHVDPHWPLGVRLHYTTNTVNADDTCSWIVLLNRIGPDDLVTAVASGALDTIIALLDVYGSTDEGIYKKTSRGVRNGDWATHNNITGQEGGGSVLQFSIELDATTLTLAAVGERVWLFGIEFDFVPMFTRHPHLQFDAGLDHSLY